MKRDLYPAKSIDMDLHLSRIVGTERFGQPPQKVWLAECKTVAYKLEIKQYFKQGSYPFLFCLESSNFGVCPLFKKNQTLFLHAHSGYSHCTRSLLFSVTRGCLTMSCSTAPECLRYAWVEGTHWAAVHWGRLQLSALSLKC